MRLSLLVGTIVLATMLGACSGKSKDEGAMAPSQAPSEPAKGEEQHAPAPGPHEGSSGE